MAEARVGIRTCLLVIAALSGGGCSDCGIAINTPGAPLPPMLPWGNSQPLAQTSSHLYVYTSSGLHVVDRAVPDKRALTTEFSDFLHGITTSASDGTSVLFTAFTDGTSPEGRPEAAWAIVSPSGWVRRQTIEPELKGGLGSWWSFDEQRFYVAAVMDAATPGAYVMQTISVLADGSDRRTFRFGFAEGAHPWTDRSGSPQPCRVGQSLVAVTRDGSCEIIVISDNEARCRRVVRSERLACNNANVRQLKERIATETGFRDIFRPDDVLSTWVRFGPRGEASLVFKLWDGTHQEFVNGTERWRTFDGAGQTQVQRMDTSEPTVMDVEGDGYLLVFPDTDRLTLLGYWNAVTVRVPGR